MAVWRLPEAPFTCIQRILLSCTLRNSAFGVQVRVISRQYTSVMFIFHLHPTFHPWPLNVCAVIARPCELYSCNSHYLYFLFFSIKFYRILWKKNKVAETEAISFSIFYNNSLYLFLILIASFYVLRTFNPAGYP